MPWTVGCFCGKTFIAPPTSCPHCASPLPDITRRPRDTPSGGPVEAGREPQAY
jgi:hypothetical protein